MPITTITSDPEALTMTIVGDYPVNVERLWQAWTDPRQLERFWGPPTWPATFTRHDVTEGGRSDYVMTGPDGERAAGYWIFEQVHEGRGFLILDGFADEEGNPDLDLPRTRMQIRFEQTPQGSRFTSLTTFPDLPAMEQIVAMGMVEGVRDAFGQMDDVLADLSSFAAGAGTELQILDDTRVRVSRIIRGSVQQVWRAHHDQDLVRRWLLGPDGWSMPVCQVAADVGDTYRYEWESDDGSARFGLEGDVVESSPPHRSVTTERMIDTDGPSTTNIMTLTPGHDGTLLTLVIMYPNMELRDQILATGMVEGMETSYARLEDILTAPVRT